MPTRRGLLKGASVVAVAGGWFGSARAAAPPPALRALLAKNREKHPGPRNSNHISMAALSLAALGGNDAQIAGLIAARIERQAAFPGGAALTASSWAAHLGDVAAVGGLKPFFAAEVGRLGVAGALRAHLPRLVPGLGAHAFHAMIRTAYGVRFDEPDEVAVGLAYWAATFLPLGDLPRAGAEADPGVVLAGIRATPALLVERPDDMNIAEKMQWVARLPDFARVANRLRVDDAALDRISRALVRVYLVPGKKGGDNFTLLHGVTGTQAYRTLEPYLADKLTGRRYLWQALAAAYLSTGAPALGPVPSTAAPTWDAIVKATLASRDDHDIKLVEIARSEFQRSNDPAYQRAAAFRMQLV